MADDDETFRFPLETQGPVSLTIHRHTDLQKEIYLFGDVHTNDFHCSLQGRDKVQSVIPLMAEMIKSDPSKVVDLFAEVQFVSALFPERMKINEGQGVLSVFPFHQDFQDCFRMDKKDCVLKNARVHYADIRGTQHMLDPEIQDSSAKLSYQLYGTIRYVNAQKSWDNPKMWRNVLVSVGKLIETLEEETMVNLRAYNGDNRELAVEMRRAFNADHMNTLTLDKMLLQSKILLQFKGMPSDLDLAMRAFFDHEFTNRIDVAVLQKLVLKKGFDGWDRLDLLKMQDAYGSRVITTVDAYFQDLERKLMLFHNALMDYYLLGRMFKQTTGKHIIVYVGDTHANTYRRFLKLLGFELKESIRDQAPNKRCLDTSVLRAEPVWSV